MENGHYTVPPRRASKLGPISALVLVLLMRCAAARLRRRPAVLFSWMRTLEEKANLRALIVITLLVSRNEVRNRSGWQTMQP